VKQGPRAERERWRDEHRAHAEELRDRLREVFRELESRLEDPPEELRRRVDARHWSTLEILEHVTIADHYLLILIEKIRDRSRRRIAAGASWPSSPPRGDHLEAVATERTPWPHPEHMRPSGTMEVALIRERLRADLGRCEAILREMPEGEGTLHRIRMSRLAEDSRLELYQYVDFLGRHAQRHLAQIDDNRASSRCIG